MHHRKLLATVAALGFAMSAFAGDGNHMSMSIAVIDDATQELVRVDLDDGMLGFRLADMQVGENRAVVDKNGQNVLITREEDGFRFDVDGKTIRTPLHRAPGVGEHDVFVMGSPHANAAPMEPLPPLPPPGLTGTTIISSEPIDEATQQAIEQLLEAAGHDADVRFIDHQAPGNGRHEVRIIEKRVEKRADATQ